MGGDRNLRESKPISMGREKIDMGPRRGNVAAGWNPYIAAPAGAKGLGRRPGQPRGRLTESRHPKGSFRALPREV